MNRHSQSSSGLVASMCVVAALAAVTVLLLAPPSSADTYACGKAGVGAPQEGDGNCSNCAKKPPAPPAAEPPPQGPTTKTGSRGPITDPNGKTNWSGLKGATGTAAGNEGSSDEPDMVDGMLGPDAGDLRFKLGPGDIICLGRGLPETPDDAILDGPNVNAPVPGRGKPPT